MNEDLIDACVKHPQGLFLGPEDAKAVCTELRYLQSDARFESFMLGFAIGAALMGASAILVICAG